MDYLHHYASPLGPITLASDGDALTGLWFDGQKHFGSTLSETQEGVSLPVFAQAERWLAIYFSGRDPGFTPPLSLRGTDYQRLIWSLLSEIPYGQTMSYGELAFLAAEKRGEGGTSARAVGAAVGRNPISLIVPCHRVLGADGSLIGYAGGVERKRSLLALEGAIHS